MGFPPLGKKVLLREKTLLYEEKYINFRTSRRTASPGVFREELPVQAVFLKPQNVGKPVTKQSNE